MTPDQAVRLYSLVMAKSKKRPNNDTISLEAHTFRELLPGIRPDKVLVEQETNQPKFAIIKKSTFCEYFKERYGITDTGKSGHRLRRDPNGKS